MPNPFPPRMSAFITNHWKVRTLLNASFVFAIVLVFCSVMIVLNIVLRSSYRDQENLTLETYGKQIAGNIDNRIEYYNLCLQQLASDRQLAYYMQHESFSVVSARLQDASLGLRTLNKGRIEGIRLHRNGFYAFRGDCLDLGGVFDKFLMGGDAYQSNYYVTCVYLNERNEKIFSIFRKLYQPNLNRVYFVELRVYESELYSFFSIKANDNRVFLLNGNVLLSTNSRGDFVKRLHEARRGKASGVSYEPPAVGVFTIRVPLRTQRGMELIIHTSIDYLERGYWLMISRVVPVVILIAAMAMGINRMISAHIQRRLRQLQAQILTLSGGNLQCDLRINGHDEFGMLSEKLESTRMQIIRLVEENNAVNEQKRIAEMSSLRSQINSHFLFNSLSSIKWLSRRNDMTSLAQAVDCLTVFLRYSLSLKEDQVSLLEEIEHLKAYTYLQKLRHMDDVEFYIDVDEELLSCKTVKLVLQPLFENAVYHGRRHDNTPLHVTLYSECDEATYSLIIEDDGMGMTQERIRDVCEGRAAAAPYGGYGLQNVMARLRMCSNDRGSLLIESQLGAFTKITIRQPKCPGK